MAEDNITVTAHCGEGRSDTADVASEVRLWPREMQSVHAVLRMSGKQSVGKFKRMPFAEQFPC